MQNSMAINQAGKAEIKRRLYKSAHQRRRRKKPRLVMIVKDEEETEWEELSDEDPMERLKRINLFKFNLFKKRILSLSAKQMRKCLRKTKVNGKYMIPKNQVGKTWVLSQSVNQRKLLGRCTKLSIDNIERISPKSAERAIMMKGLIDGKE